MHVTKKKLVTVVVTVMSSFGVARIAQVTPSDASGLGEHVAHLYHGSTRQDALDVSMTGRTNLATLGIQSHR